MDMGKDFGNTGDGFSNERRPIGVERLPAAASRGAIAWPRQNLFSSPLNAALTLGCIVVVIWAGPPLIRFFFLDAVWSGTDRAACIKPLTSGACWPFVRAWLSYFVYGFYPADQRWRVDGFFAALAFGIAWLAWLEAPRRGLGAVYFFIVLPLVSFVLLARRPADRASCCADRSVGRHSRDLGGRHRRDRRFIAARHAPGPGASFQSPAGAVDGGSLH